MKIKIFLIFAIFILPFITKSQVIKNEIRYIDNVLPQERILGGIINKYVYSPRFPDSLIVDKFLDKNGKEVIVSVIPGIPPSSVRRAPIASLSAGAVALSNVPAFDWSFGCTATSAAMIAGYFDNNGYPNMYSGPTNNGIMPLTNQIWGSVIINGETRKQCPLSATRNGLDGRTIRGHVDDYWIKYGNGDPDPYITNGWTQHTYSDCTADYLKTSQSAYGNNDGWTRFYYYPDGSAYTGSYADDMCYGFGLFLESRGYTVINRYNQLIQGYNGNTLGFTFNQFVAEINAGRPVIIHVTGHTMVGFGYDLTGNTVYLHDTWDYSAHSMTWGGSYSGMDQIAVSVFQLAPSTTLIAPVAIAATNITNNSFSSRWNASSGATGYYLDVSKSSTFSSFVTGYSNKSVGNVVTSAVTGLTAGTTYYYRVRAYNAGGTSSNSNIISTVTIPSNPVAIAATNVTQSSFSAKWNASPGATGYYLDVSTSSTFASFLADYSNKSVGNVFTSLVSGLTANMTYYYRIRAFNANGTSGNSNTINTVTTTLSVSPTSISLGYGSGSNGTFAITSNTSWSITDNGSWLDVSPVSGTNNGTITVKANNVNTGTIPRTATVTIIGTGVTPNQTVTVTQANQPGTTKTLGNMDVYASSAAFSNRAAMPVTFSEAGSIKSISIYHNGGTGSVLLGVYSDATATPATRLGVSASTVVNTAAGWQTVSLLSPVSVTSGQTVWLSFVFQTNPGIRYVAGTPARALSTATWSGGMPAAFGAATFANFKYSLYCTYTPGGPPVTKTLGNTDIYASSASFSNRAAMPVTFTEAGSIQSITIYHNGGTGSVMLGVYSDAAAAPATRLGVSASTLVNTAAGWQTVALTSPLPVTSGQTVWLSFVFQTNPGIRYLAGTPSRALSTATWSGGMPATFGAATFANFKYSLYCTYTTGASPNLTVSLTSISLGYGLGSNGTFTITSNTSWSITDDASWLNVSPVSGTNNGTITVTANSANTGASPRTASVTIAGTGVTPNKTVTVTQANQPTTTKTLGNMDIYASSASFSNRAAMPVTFTEAGSIQSITIYHNGGTGSVMLGVYSDAAAAPATRLGVSASTLVNTAAGWQTVALTSPLPVTSGQTVWLSFVFQTNPGIRYIAGTPARALSTATWTGGMPATFGAATFANFKYSLYCTYTTGGPITRTLGNTDVYASSASFSYRAAMPVTFSEAGSIQSISIYHNGGTGSVLMGVYDHFSGSPAAPAAPTGRLGVTAATVINSTNGWQTVTLTSPVSVTSGQTVWLSFVFQTNPGIRYIAGTPARALSTATWSGGMPAIFGAATSTFADFKYSLYCTYTTGGAKTFEIDNPVASTIEKATSKLTMEVYPNPSNGVVNFRFCIENTDRTTLEIFSVTGKRITLLMDERMEAGDIRTVPLAQELPEGIYLYQLRNGKQVVSGKFIRTR